MSTAAQASEATFVEIRLSCEGLKNKPNQKPYSTEFNGIISADGLSFVGHETWKNGAKDFHTKQFTGLMDFNKRTAFIKGVGRSHRSKNTWPLYFQSSGVSTFYQALVGSGMKGREGTGDWKKPCTMRLIKSAPVSDAKLRSKIEALEKSASSSQAKYLKSSNELRSKIEALEKSADSSHAKYLKSSNEARSLQVRLKSSLEENTELKKQMEDKNKSLALALSEVNEFKRKNVSSANADQAQKAIKQIAKLEKELLAANNQITKLSASLKASDSKSQRPLSWANFQSQIEIQQRQFCSLAENFFYKLQEAKKTKNEIRVNVVFMERQEDIAALIPQGDFSNWIFEVVKIDQVPDGSAAVILKLQCDTTVGSGYLDELAAAGEDRWRATIPYNDRRYRELAKLSAGQFVTASGKFLEVEKFKPGQPETFYASMPIGSHPLVKNMSLTGELFVADFSYIAALND